MLKPKENQCDFHQFLSVSAREFMELPEDRIPELDLETQFRKVAIHVLDAKAGHPAVFSVHHEV